MTTFNVKETSTQLLGHVLDDAVFHQSIVNIVCERLGREGEGENDDAYWSMFTAVTNEVLAGMIAANAPYSC